MDNESKFESLDVVPVVKNGGIKQKLVDTAVFPILNTDIFLLIIISLCVIITTVIITLIFIENVTVLKLLTGLLSSLIAFILSVAKIIIPKGIIAKSLEKKFFPPGNKFENTQNIIKRKYSLEKK